MEELHQQRAVLKCVRIKHGALFVMTSGVLPMPVWFASNLATPDLVSKLLVSLRANITCCFKFVDSTAYSNARFGQGSGLIHLDNVACTGTEDSLLSCTYDADTSDCFHSEDAGVSCDPECKHCM